VAQTTWEIGFKAGMGAAKLTGDDVGSFTFVFDQDNYLEGDIGDMRMGFVGGDTRRRSLIPSSGCASRRCTFRRAARGSIGRA